MPGINLERLLLLAPVILLALTVHEYCHALVADRLGDSTARMQGRLSLNPLVHLDIFGTILIFLVGFGWAKPVPINLRNLDDPKRGMMLIALAGPVSNLVMAILAGLVLRSLLPGLGAATPTTLITVLKLSILSIQINVALAVFNMIPLPPLDGSRVIYGLLPQEQAMAYSRIEPYGVMILFGLFIFGGQLFHSALWYPIGLLTDVIAGTNF